jgi:hypothetical protein
MERDMDLVKKILLAMEKKQPSDLRNEDLEIEGYLGRTRIHLHEAPDDQRRAIKITPPPFFSFSMQVVDFIHTSRNRRSYEYLPFPLVKRV